MFKHKGLDHFIASRSMGLVTFLPFIFYSLLVPFYAIKVSFDIVLQKGTYSLEENVIQLQSEMVGNASKVI